MREIRPYGSVRGVAGNRYPYRDSQKPHSFTAYPSAKCVCSPPTFRSKSTRLRHLAVAKTAPKCPTLSKDNRQRQTRPKKTNHLSKIGFVSQKPMSRSARQPRTSNSFFRAIRGSMFSLPCTTVHKLGSFRDSHLRDHGTMEVRH